MGEKSIKDVEMAEYIRLNDPVDDVHLLLENGYKLRNDSALTLNVAQRGDNIDSTLAIPECPKASVPAFLIDSSRLEMTRTFSTC